MSDYDKAFLVWLEYYIATEEFDRTLPGKMEDHGWMPYWSHRKEMYENCRKQLGILHDKLVGLDVYECSLAKKNAVRYDDLDEMKRIHDGLNQSAKEGAK